MFALLVVLLAMKGHGAWYLAMQWHIISASAGHGDLRGFYASRWTLPFSAIADDLGSIRALVRREHAFGSDWIKPTNVGGYFSPGDDPARATWFDDEIEALTSTAHQLGMPVAVHAGAAEGCKQVIHCGAGRLEHAYLINAEGIEMAERAGAYSPPNADDPGGPARTATGPCHVRQCGSFGATMGRSSYPSGCWREAE